MADGNCEILANSMNDFCVSVSEHLPRLNVDNEVFTVEGELPDECIISTSKEPVCPRVELILKIIIILLIIFLGFIKSKPC